MPQIDAVWISHEHEDHFNIPTLSRIDRRIPIYLSARSSIAASSILDELGFRVRSVEPGESLQLGDLMLTAFCGDHVTRYQGDEWDTLAYLFEQQDGDGAFFTNVDIVVTSAMTNKLNRVAGDVITCEGMKLALFGSACASPETPAEMHQPSQTGDFCSAVEGLRVLRRGDSFRPKPGQTLVLENGRLVEIRETTDFLAAAAPPWPDREAFWPSPGSPLGPARCGRQTFDNCDLDELESGLGELARHLYGGALFKHLYSLSCEDLEGRLPTFALMLHAGQGKILTYEYRPQACNFSMIDEKAGDRYAGTIALWANDLVSLFRGEMEPRMIANSSKEVWAVRCHARFFIELWIFFHPLRRPEQALEQYRSTAREEAGSPIWILPPRDSCVDGAAASNPLDLEFADGTSNQSASASGQAGLV